MQFEHEIQYCYDKYPSLFRRRWEVLNHLFCVIGNGFEWVNGELVEKGERKIKNYVPLLKDGEAYRSEESIREQVSKENKKMDEWIIKHNQEYEKLGISHLINTWPGEKTEKEIAKTYNVEFYPLSEYSAIFNIPEDIKPDWLEGIKEVVNLLLIHGHGDELDEMNEYQIANHKLYTGELNKLAEKLEIKSIWSK